MRTGSFGRVLALVLLFISVSCAPTTQQPPPPPSPSMSGLTTIALTRITYGDQGPDAFCRPDPYDELQWQLKQALERKGYRVLKAAIPAKENSNRPDPWASASASQLLPYLPKNAQALLRVRVDRYLALDLCSAEAIRTLEMDGNAELFKPGSATPVWTATAKAGDTSISKDENLPFRVGAELAGNLLISFPPVTGR